MINIIKVMNFVKEENLKLVVEDGLAITDSKGRIRFYDRDITQCFNNAAKWINNRK